MKLCLAVLVVLVLAFGRISAGEIKYDSANNSVIVSGYPEEQPATLDDVLTADRKGGWGKISYDQGTDTFTLRASLYIGTNADWGTFFQIGRAKHSKETLVLQGDLLVTPPKNTSRPVKIHSDYAGGRRDGGFRVSNRLTLGDIKNADIKPTVKMACSRKNEFAVKVLMEPMPSNTEERFYVPIGELFMYNSVLTAATPDAGHTYTAAITLSHTGVNYCLRNSTMSWWDGILFQTAYFYVQDLPKAGRDVLGMTFENGGNASGPFNCVDCVFRNLTVGCADRSAVRCVFEGNQSNYELASSHSGVVFTDCVFGPTKKPLKIPHSTRDEQWLRNYSVNKRSSDLKLVLNPGVVERSSLPVEVLGDNGRPVKGAAVIVECADDKEGLAIARNLAVTDDKGLTPSDAEGRAIVINWRDLRPTTDPAKPDTIHYSYILRVSAPGYKEWQAQIQTGAVPLPRPYRVVLVADRSWGLGWLPGK